MPRFSAPGSVKAALSLGGGKFEFGSEAVTCPAGDLQGAALQSGALDAERLAEQTLTAIEAVDMPGLFTRISAGRARAEAKAAAARRNRRRSRWVGSKVATEFDPAANEKSPSVSC